MQPQFLRLHVNAFALALEEAHRAFRAGHTVPSVALLEAVQTVARFGQVELLVAMLDSAFVTTRILAPGVLPEPGASAELEIDVVGPDGDSTALHAFGPGHDLATRLRPVHVGSQLFAALATGDKDQAQALVHAALEGNEHGAAVSFALMIVTVAMCRHTGQVYPPAPCGVRARCADCDVWLSQQHEVYCPQALCAWTGQDLAACSGSHPRACRAGVWEGHPAGYEEAKARRWWCLPGRSGCVPVGRSTPGARVDVERLRREGQWSVRDQTWK